MKTIDRSQLPGWTRYVIVLWPPVGARHGGPAPVAPFSTIERAVSCMRDIECAFDCEVIRVDGDVLVWPWHVKGGDA